MNERVESHLGRPVTVVTTDGRPAAATLSERVRSLRLPTQVAAGRGPNQRLPWTLAITFAVVAALLAYVVVSRPAVEPTTEQPASVLPSLTTPSPAAGPAPGTVVLESKGYIIPAHQIQVSPKVGGMVVKLPIEEGKRVKKGDVVAEIETVDYQARRDAAQARADAARHRYLELKTGYRPQEIEQAEAELKEVAAQREQLYQEWRRNINLKTGQALSQRDYEQAESQYRAMAHREVKLKFALELMKEGPRVEKIDAALADLKQAEAELAEAQIRLDWCTVRAPVTGTILTKKAEEGNIVNPAAFSLSASLCDMADLSDLEVDLKIQERDLAKVFQGQKCRVRADAYPDRVYDGVVSRLMPIADRAQGAIPVRVKVKVPREEEGVFLKPEMGAVVAFLK